MGLIKAIQGAVGGVLADQWREYFYCESLQPEVLVSKGMKRTSSRGRSSNTSGEDNIITNGSIIAVNSGQCMIIVEQGKVVEVCAEPGEFVYDNSTEPTVFDGGMENIKSVFMRIGKRFTMGGDTGKDQRVYYFNTKEIVGNKYGTPSAVPYRVVDQKLGLDMDITIKCFGEYSYKVTNPILFYTNVCGNVEEDYRREEIDGQLKTEVLTALQGAFAKISDMGIRYSALPGHTTEIADALNQVLSSKWRDLRGLEIVSFGVSSVKADEKYEEMISNLQRNAVFSNPTMAAANLAAAQADAMKLAAQNSGGGMGAAMGFMGMNMAQNAGGMNAANLFAMGQGGPQGYPPQGGPQGYPQGGPQGQAPAGATGMTGAAGAWDCSCGQKGNTGKFCASCGKPKPEPKPPADAWDCSCGQKGNTGKFCSACGQPKPAPKTSEGDWDCSCGQKGNTGKFCSSCGKPRPEPAAEGWTCQCGTVNQGNFCSSCGAKRPAGAPLYKCDKCGWIPPDPHNPPKFCPQCGDPFNEGDVQK